MLFKSGFKQRHVHCLEVLACRLFFVGILEQLQNIGCFRVCCWDWLTDVTGEKKASLSTLFLFPTHLAVLK